MSRVRRITGRAPSRIAGARPLAHDVALAGLLTAAGLLETLAGPGGDGSRAVSAVAVAAMTLPLARRRSAPLLPLAAGALALIAQAALGGFLVAGAVTPLVALAVALYSAGRHVETAYGLAAGAVGVVVVAGTRVVVDPSAGNAGQAALTLVAVALPLIIGRWVRSQALLRRTLAQTAERLRRDRERDARAAAEEERMRIAGDLQAAIAGGLREIVGDARELHGLLQTGEHDAARALLAGIATTARDALADVRRVLGILRRDDGAPRLEPPRAVAVREPTNARARARESAVEEPRAAADGEPPFDGAPELDAGRPRTSAQALDRLLAIAALAIVELGLLLAAPAGDRWTAALTGVAIVAPLPWRRRRPVLVVAVVLAAVALQSALVDFGSFPVADILAIVCATYALGAHTERRAALAGLAVAVLGAGAHAAIFYPGGIAAALLGGVVAPWTIGRVVRGNRQLTREGRAEAARAERAREREARAAVMAERMRVARELHDAVAHNISVIAIQAAGADGIVDRDPERAAGCATLIETVAREAISELERLAGDIEHAPPPSLAQVATLAERAGSAGQPVELRVEGEPAALPAGVDLAAYRIVQEALANAAKHAGGARASVVVRYQPRAVELEIADDGRATLRHAEPRDGTGHGLVGMRERVALYGGTLDASRRPSGGFRVHARLPLSAT